MMRFFKYKRSIVILGLACLLGLGGCSSAPLDENDPVAMLKDAEDDISSDHFQIALDKLRLIKNKFPYSKQAVEAHLRMGDVFFLQESFAESAATYESFRDLHPKHEKAPYAFFRIGKSYYNDIPGTIARDLTSAMKSLEAYTAFMQRYPTAPEAVEAKKDISDVRQRLAQKELYIAEFYFKREFYESAQPRYKKVIDLYPETAEASVARTQLEAIQALKARSNERGALDGRESSGGNSVGSSAE